MTAAVAVARDVPEAARRGAGVEHAEVTHRAPRRPVDPAVAAGAVMADVLVAVPVVAPWHRGARARRPPAHVPVAPGAPGRPRTLALPVQALVAVAEAAVVISAAAAAAVGT